MIKQKKNYNPFKMWGSWVGAIIGFFVIPTYFCIFGCELIFAWQIIPRFFFNSSGIEILFYLYFIGVPVTLGFLIGWGIHNLIRRFKK